MITALNDVVIVPLQHKNTGVPLQGTNIVLHEVDPADEVEPENFQLQVPRKSTRERRSVVTNDYIVYHLQEYEFDIGLEDDPTSLNEAKLNIHSIKWSNVMKDELKFMKDNDI